MIALLERHGVTIVGMVHAKQEIVPLSRHVYASSIANAAKQFDAQLRAASTTGLMILDARTHFKNVPSVHSITTQKFRTGGDMLPGLVESPVFGHSDSHVVLQIADLVASALLFPLACLAFCQDARTNVHTHEKYEEIRFRFGTRVRNLEHRYTAADGKRTGGIVVADRRNQLQAHTMYVSDRDANGEPKSRSVAQPTLEVSIADAPPKA